MSKIGGKLLASILLVVGIIVGVVGGYFWGHSAGYNAASQAYETKIEETESKIEALLPFIGKTIKIGAILPLSGALAPFGQQALRGLEFIVSKVNAEGGILGAKLELLVEDFGGDPKVAMSAAEKLITVDKVNVITGCYMSAAIMTVMEVTEKHKVPFLSIGGAANELTQKGAKYYWRTVQNASIFSLMTMKFLSEVIKPGALGIVYEDTLRGESTFKAFDKLSKEYGINIVVAEKYPLGSLDFKPLISKVRAINPDALIVVAYITDCVLLAKQMKEMGYYPKAIVIEAGTQLTDYLRLAGEESKYWFVQSYYWPDRNYPDREICYKWGLEFYRKYGTALDGYAKDSIVNVLILKEVLEKTKTLDPDKIRRAMIEGDFFISFFGRVRFNEAGDNIDSPKTFAMAQILPVGPEIPWNVNGLSYISVWPSHMKVAEPVYPMPKS
ncbi:MAG: ABC transporter substrate-binding protein [Candidatus Bathyarchaeia archaeon]